MSKKKILNIYVILELIFGIIGGAFLIPAILTHVFMDRIIASPSSQGNVEILPVVFGIIAATFIGLSGMFWYFDYKYQKKRQRLMESGRRIWARVTDIEVNRYVEVNMRHPRNIICTYEDATSGRTYTFRSDNIFMDASYYNGKEISVLVDNSNYSCYYVEVDEDKLLPLR